jgi:hypothetical protein
VSRRARVAAFGSATALVVVGVVGAALIAGGTGQYVAFSLIGLGLVAVVRLGFLEIGLSEDRELAENAPRQEGRRPRRAKLDRSRSHRRRLG